MRRISILSIRQGNVDTRRTVDNVAVGENQTVWSKYKPRAATLPLTLLTGAVTRCLGDVNFYTDGLIFSAVPTTACEYASSSDESECREPLEDAIADCGSNAGPTNS